MNKLRLLFCLFCLSVCLSSGLFSQNSRQLFDLKTIGEIRLTMPQKNWVDALDSMRLYGDGLLPATVVVDGAKFGGAGVRFRGNNSYQLGLRRNPMSIKLNMTDATVNHQGSTSLKLSSALRDPSMIREALFFEIARKYVPASQVSYSKLYVNEEFIGLFVNVEGIDAPFLQRNFGSTDGALFKASPEFSGKTTAGCKQNLHGSLEYEESVDCYRNNFEMESADGWKDLQEMTRVLAKSPDKIESILDVDRVLWMLALNNVMVNLSSYSGQNSQNFYLYQDKNGRFQPIFWDLNLAFGSFKNANGNDLDLGQLQKLDPLLHADNPYKPLASQLLKDPFWRKMYLAHIRQIVEENFENGWYERRAQELQGLIVVPFSEDLSKNYSLDDFQKSLKTTIGKKSKIPGIAELMSKRVRFLKSHAEISPLPPMIIEQKVAGREHLSNKNIQNFRVTARVDRFPKRVKIFFRFADDEAWASQFMEEETPAEANSGRSFSSTIGGRGDRMSYFIVAENAGAVAISPENYFAKPFEVKLSDLNK